uniref:Uncharacterized protein n=1 Tax=Octopus bimaculoides TaxID=37653 RepID=A0A0L8FUC6_OCTBM
MVLIIRNCFSFDCFRIFLFTVLCFLSIYSLFLACCSVNEFKFSSFALLQQTASCRNAIFQSFITYTPDLNARQRRLENGFVMS